MRLKLTFDSEKGFIGLPIHHHKILQGFIYKNLPKYLAEFLHNIGFYYKNRNFKLFTFSKIFSEKFRIKNQKMYFNTPFIIYLSSAINEIPQSFKDSIIYKEKINLGKNEVILKNVEFIETPEYSSNIVKIKTLSPIVVYKTIEDKKKFTKYFSPLDQEFNELIKTNIQKKYEILTGTSLNDFQFLIKGVNTYSKILKYKNFIIKGTEGIFEILVKPEIFRTIYDCGIGAKNSQGFGMIEIAQE